MRAPASLDGLLVIDAATTLAGPIAAALLGDYGATVIKVEHPSRGDAARRIGRHEGSWWKWVSRNKQCVTCDLSKPEGKELFERLVAKADILIENFRPGRMEAWGVGYKQLQTVNPGLVMLSVSGFGQDGPYAAQRGYGTLAEAISGVTFLTGDADGPPALQGYPLADSMAGVWGAAVAMFAVWSRAQRGGEGEYIDMALYAPLLWMLGSPMVEFDETGRPPQRRGGSLGPTPRNIKRCGDDTWVAYSMPDDWVVRSLVGMLGMGEDTRFQTTAGRRKNVDAIDDAFGEWIARRPRSEALARCADADVPIAPVYDLAELVVDAQVVARHDIVHATDAEGRVVRMPNIPARMSREPDGWAGHDRPTGAALGAHNREVYGGLLDLDDASLARLTELGVI